MSLSLVDYLGQRQIPPTRPSLIEAETDHVITYEDLWTQVDQLAVGLGRLGLQPSERVILALPNSIAWVVSFLAILKVGGVVVPVRESAVPGELKRIITHVKPSLFIGDSSFINRSLPFDLLDSDERVVICSRQFMVRTSPQNRVKQLDELLKQPYGDQPRLTLTQPQTQMASINFTYRGYGYPLGAMLTHENYINGIKTYTETAGLHKGQRFLVALPLSHTYPVIGCLLVPLAIGATAVIVRNSSAQSIWDAIGRYHLSVVTGVPTLYVSLLRSMNSHFSDLRIEEAICGGSTMSISLYEQIRHRWRISLRQGYGLTECLPVTCNPSIGNRPETLGRTVVGVDGVEVRILGEDHNKKATGEIGEITVGGPTVMAGYYAMPRETSEVMRNGWFYTGDRGWFDAEGFLHFAGVKKRIVKVGGNMVDLAEVEREILTYPGVLQVNVYPVPDEKFGEIVSADIRCGASKSDIKVIRRYLRSRLASYKIPLIIRCAT